MSFLIAKPPCTDQHIRSGAQGTRPHRHLPPNRLVNEGIVLLCCIMALQERLTGAGRSRGPIAATDPGAPSRARPGAACTPAECRL